MVERDKNGRFLKGSSGNDKGRPKKEREDRYYEIMRSTVSYEDWEKIIKRAAQQAIGGDDRARKFLAEYLIGKPVQELKVEGQTDLSIILAWDDAEIEPDATGAA